MQFQITTFGCKVNQAESAGLASVLTAHGLTETKETAEADVLIVNSCAVTGESVRKAKQLIRSLRRRNPEALLLLTGCWPQAFSDDDFSGADFVTGTRDRAALLSWLFEALKARPASGGERQITPYRKGDPFSEIPCADTTRTRAFLKIQDGCNQFCSYCIIPYARGRCRSMPLDRLRQEAAALSAQGFREIVLTGINLGFFGDDTGCTIADAVEICAEQTGFVRVRLGSLEPERMTPALLDRLSHCEKLCPQFHLSLQSGSDSVLRRMNRRYTAAEYRTLAENIHRLFPGAALTTDVIVGFPGETEAEFAETLAFVREIGFAKVHVFPFSQRAGTRAAAMPDQVPPAVRAERAARLSALADEIRSAHLASRVGQRLSVLVEGEKQQNAQTFFSGHTPEGTLVKIFTENCEKGLQNSLICVTIEGYEQDSLTAVYRSGEEPEHGQSRTGCAE